MSVIPREKFILQDFFILITKSHSTPYLVNWKVNSTKTIFFWFKEHIWHIPDTYQLDSSGILRNFTTFIILELNINLGHRATSYHGGRHLDSSLRIMKK
jgi:hypothetical protein